MVELANPFTPSFGGLPKRFFGRTKIVDRVESALENPSSPDRALFITGSRGCGKTALLERLSESAAKERWLVVDVHSAHAESSIREKLLRSFHSVRTSADPHISLPAGIDVPVGRVGNTAGAPDNLATLLVECCEALASRRGVYISVDEIQKIPEADMEAVCASVQMARRKGLPVALMLAGLPGSKERVASYKGCTFMQRVEDIRIGGLHIGETVEAFNSMLSLTPDIRASEEVVWRLSSMSQGYPYLIQLVGYHFVEYVRAAYPVGLRIAQEDDAVAIDDQVYLTYRENVLKPSLRGLGHEGRAYLRALAEVRGADGIALGSEIARVVGKSVKQLSSCRQGLVSRRLVLPVGRGRVCFGLPYLTRYSLEQSQERYFDTTDNWIPV